MENIKLLTIITLLTQLIIYGCCDSEDCPDRFHVPAQIIPYQKEYHIGDTITFISKFDRHVHELQTDKKYDMKGIKWFPNAIIKYLDTIGNNNSKLKNHFSLNLENNCKEFIVSFNDDSVIDCEYIYSEDTFSLMYQFIPKRTGNYFLSQKCAIGPDFNEQDFPGKCKFNGYDVIVDMNPGQDGNIEILKLAKDSLYNNWMLLDLKARFYDRGGFCFTVVP